MKRRISSDYLGPVFTELDKYVDKTVAALKDLEFDAIAFRGNSGALIAPIIAHVMKKDLILVRKEGSHSNSKLEGRTDEGVRYVIIDDFVVTGGTLHEILKVIKNNITDAVCVGVYLYQEDKRSFGDVNNKFKKYMRLKRIIGPLDELSDDPDHVAAAKAQAEMIRQSIEAEDSPTVDIMIERTKQGYADPLSPDPNVELKTAVRRAFGPLPSRMPFFEKARQMGKTLEAAEQLVTEGVERKLAVDFENQPKRPWPEKAQTFAEMYSPNFGRAMEPPKANQFQIQDETVIVMPQITPVELKRITDLVSDLKLDARFLTEAKRTILQLDDYFDGPAERQRAIRRLYGEKVADDIERIERAGRRRLRVVRPTEMADSTADG